MNDDKTEKTLAQLGNWPVLVLLGVLSVSSVGGYGQLSSLNDRVAETNRLSEARGASSARIQYLEQEVNRLRAAMDDKVDNGVFLEQVAGSRERFQIIVAQFEFLATTEQLNVLIGRVDAISRRIDSVVKERQ